MSKGSMQFTDAALNREAFADRLRQLLSARGAIPELARMIGVSVPAIRRWVAGEAEPSRDYLVATAEALHVSVEWLATGRGAAERFEKPVESSDELPVRWVLDAIEGLEEWLAENGKKIADPKAKRETVLALATEAWKRELAKAKSDAANAPSEDERGNVIDMSQAAPYLRVIAR